MAISPITIATQGTLNSPLAVAAVRGHLTTGAIIAPPKGGGLGWGAYGRWKHPQLERDELMQQIQREDDEIITIIAAFMEIMNK